MDDHISRKVVHNDGFHQLHEKICALGITTGRLTIGIRTFPDPKLQIDINDFFGKFAEKRLDD